VKGAAGGILSSSLPVAPLYYIQASHRFLNSKRREVCKNRASIMTPDASLILRFAMTCRSNPCGCPDSLVQIAINPLIQKKSGRFPEHSLRNRTETDRRIISIYQSYRGNLGLRTTMVKLAALMSSPILPWLS
jgi:hypothetical protein